MYNIVHWVRLQRRCCLCDYIWYWSMFHCSLGSLGYHFTSTPWIIYLNNLWKQLWVVWDLSWYKIWLYFGWKCDLKIMQWKNNMKEIQKSVCIARYVRLHTHYVTWRDFSRDISFNYKFCCWTCCKSIVVIVFWLIPVQLKA